MRVHASERVRLEATGVRDGRGGKAKRTAKESKGQKRERERGEHKVVLGQKAGESKRKEKKGKKEGRTWSCERRGERSKRSARGRFDAPRLLQSSSLLGTLTEKIYY